MTELEQRRQAVSAVLAERKIDALLVSSPANIRYLTGFAGSNALVLMTGGGADFFTDPRYAIDAGQNIACKVHISKKPLIDDAAALVKKKRLKKIGVEPAWMNVGQHAQLRKLVPKAAFEPVSGIVEEFRNIKSPSEIAAIRKSVMVNSEAYLRTLRRIRVGNRERDVAGELEYQMRLMGAEKPSFDTIVAAGERTALPHAHPTGRKIGVGEFLLIDMGTFVDGYASDMTRVSFMGVPSRQARTIYNAVLEAQLAAIDAVRDGAKTSRVDGAAREVLKKHGMEREFVHSTGHGLGLEIHETPKIAKKDKTVLRAGMAITIEPGVYIEGVGGVRIEDTVLVTERGCEILTPTPKELVSL